MCAFDCYKKDNKPKILIHFLAGDCSFFLTI